jgi:tetratricopeptide (TPR) repeat protein
VNISRWGLALLLVVTALIYGQALSFEFVGVDDPDYVTENAEVLAGLTADGVSWAMTTGHAGNWHPLTWLSHMVDVELFGVDAGRHHMTNVALHLANTWLLFTLLVALSGCRGRSLFVAAVFALHPVHVESVAWISERKDVLSTFFGLAAMLAWVGWTRGRGLGAYFVAFVCLALSLMSKPMLVTLPAVLLLFDIWPLRRWRLGGAAARDDRLKSHEPVPLLRLLLEKLPLLALCLGSSLITWMVQRSGGAMDSTESVGLGSRLANGVVAVVRYIGLTFWPSDLGLLHPHPELPGGTPLAAWQVGGACALVLLLTVLAWRGRRAGWPLVGWLLYLGMLVPVIGIVQVGDQALAERYLYLPMTGLAVLVAWGAVSCARSLRGAGAERSLCLAGIVVVGALGTVSREQLGHWRTSVTLLEQALTVAPRSPTLHVALGHDLEKLGQHEGALAHFETALREAPGHPGAHHYMAVALRTLGRTEEAIEHYRAALENHPGDAQVHYNLAIALGALNDVDGAIEQYRAALAIDERYGNAHGNLGAMLIMRGDWTGAESHLAQSLALAPNQPAVSFNRARALIEQGRFGDAEACMKAALKLDGSSARLHEVLGRMLSSQGRCPEALEHLERAIALAPKAAGAAQRAAWIYGTHPSAAVRKPQRALELAQRVDELTGHQAPLALDTLAAAHAAVGHMEQAAALLSEAMALTDATDLLSPMSERLAGYRLGQPARDESLVTR